MNRMGQPLSVHGDVALDSRHLLARVIALVLGASVRGEREANVNYRHVIGSLVRKPGAFARYRFREQMFPTMTFRLAYDALKRWRGERTDVEYLRILHLAATTMESTVDSALALLLEAGEPFDYATVKELANPAPPRAPVLSLSGMPDLRVYDSLLAGVA